MHVLDLIPRGIESKVLIPNHTFLLPSGGISGEFGRATVRIVARRSRAKIPMARPNELDMPPKHTKKVRLGIHRTQNLASDSNSDSIVSESECFITYRRSWPVISSLVLAETFFCAFFRPRNTS